MVRRPVFFLLAIFVIVLDQLTKQWAVQSVSEYDHIRLIPDFLYITRTTNTGAAFGMLPHSSNLLACTALLVLAGIGAYVIKAQWPIPALLAVGIALPFGGALGNFIDRMRLGYVVDFIEVRLGSYTWPIFNVADSAICVGVCLLAIAALTAPSSDRISVKETNSTV